MGKKDPRIDAYIAKAAPFARPILAHFRRVVHAACPDVEETMKWSNPHFDYHGIFCAMAAFKGHCAIGFWRAAMLKDVRGMPAKGEDAMGQFGRVTSLADLPDEKTLRRIVKVAAKLNADLAAGTVARPARPRAAKRPPPEVPDDFLAALRKQPVALKAFQAFSPSHQREYVEWITEAKREETRARRLAKAVAQIAEGKSQHWKYERT